jgi:spermidine/putrescine transport system permease protein
MKKAPGLRSYTLFYLLFLYGPIILLPIFAFNDSRVVAFPLQGFTTGWFAEMPPTRTCATPPRTA